MGGRRLVGLSFCSGSLYRCGRPRALPSLSTFQSGHWPRVGNRDGRVKPPLAYCACFIPAAAAAAAAAGPPPAPPRRRRSSLNNLFLCTGRRTQQGCQTVYVATHRLRASRNPPTLGLSALLRNSARKRPRRTPAHPAWTEHPAGSERQADEVQLGAQRRQKK